MDAPKIWDGASEEKREELLEVLGYDEEWAKLSWAELGSRGGGMIQRDLIKLNDIREKRD